MRGMVVARRRVICIISPRKSAYSETFIQAHLKRLPAEVKLLHGTLMRGGDFPAMTGDDRPLLSLAERGLTLLWREAFGIRVTRFQDAALRRYLRREKVEAVLAEFGYTGASVSDACHAAGVPLIVHFHGNDAFKQKWLGRYQAAYQRMFSTVAAVIAVSRDSEQRLADLGAPRDRLFYDPCGADTSIFTGADPGTSPPTFLSVGRFVDTKAPHLTLLAFRDVARACPEARLIMVGDGVLMEACRQLTMALDMEKAVDFLGVQSPAEIAALMREVRAFVLHSVTTSEDDVEGTPVAVLEAGAAGLPVVSTRHAGIKDVVVHTETGFLVEEGDIQAMARYMIELIRSPALAARLGKRARAHVSTNFSQEKSLATLWRIIEGVMPRDGS
jgi:colanic acid/amylovoran biosynthesis glycosyltransferase